MKSTLAAAFLAICVSFTQGCKPGGNPTTLIGSPRFVLQSSPDSLVENGIRQDPTTGGIYLQWYKMADAAGYRIYRSDSTNQNGSPILFSLVASVSSATAIVDTFVVDANSIQTGVRYYYFLRAYGSDGSSSIPSDTIDYKLLPRPALQYPGPNAAVASSDLEFSWEDRTGGGFTVIRVKDVTGIPSQNIWITPRFNAYGGTSTTRVFDFDSTATSPLLSGRSYEWRVIRFDPGANDGSTSPWSTFSVN